MTKSEKVTAIAKVLKIKIPKLGIVEAIEIAFKIVESIDE